MSGAAPADFRRRIRAGEVLIGSFLNLGSSLTAELMGVVGLDWLVIDLEHGAGGEQEALAQMQALAHTRAAPLVRVEAVDRARFLRVLDRGAAGVIVPRIESVDDARRSVEYCRYAGGRGVARYNRSWHWGLGARELTEVDEEITCVVQIETRSALAAAGEIAAVEGVDVLFVGPTDLAHSLRIRGGPDSPELEARILEVGTAAREHGKAAGIFVTTLEQAARFRELGFVFLSCSSDSGLLAQEARRVADGLRALKSSAASLMPLQAKESER